MLAVRSVAVRGPAAYRGTSLITPPPPQEHHRSLGIILLYGPTGWRFLIEVTLWRDKWSALSGPLSSCVPAYK